MTRSRGRSLSLGCSTGLALLAFCATPLAGAATPRGGAALGVPQSRTCPGAFHFLPGSGEITVTEVKVTRVPCASAKAAIVRFSRLTGVHTQFVISGHPFVCSFRDIRPEAGVRAQLCVRSPDYSVSWHSAFVI